MSTSTGTSTSTRPETDSPAPVDEVKLAIEGMSSASCVRRVERALLGVDGTRRVSVNLATRTALVELAAPVEPQRLADAVKSLGYRAAIGPAAGPAEAKGDHEPADLSPWGGRAKLVVGVVLTAAVLVLAYAFGGDGWSPYVQLALTLPVFAWVGWDFHAGAIKGLRHGSVGMDTLVSVGSTVALVYSVAATAAGHDATAYDVTAVILTVISIGRYLEGVTRRRAHAAVDSLARLRPRTAHLMTPGSDPAATDFGSGAPYVDVAAADLRHGDTVLVLPGEAVPADGSVLEGRAAVDESLLTGESFPVAKGPGDEVTGGTVNGLSPIKVRVVRTGADTTLARILASVERAQTEKSRAQRLADRVARCSAGDTGGVRRHVRRLVGRRRRRRERRPGRRRSADRGLSVRPGPGHPGRHNGRRGPRGRARAAHIRWGSSGAGPRRARRGAGQDRNSDRRPPGGDGTGHPGRDRRDSRSRSGRGGRGPVGASPRPGHRRCRVRLGATPCRDR